MPQPKTQLRKPRNRANPRSDIHNLLEVIRVLDRSVVEISMHIYGVPRRQRAKMREQHRRLHDTIRNRMPRLPDQSRENL